MAGLGAIMGILGTGLQVVGSIQAANAAKAQAESAANIAEKRGKEEFAIAQRRAVEEQRKGEYARSRAMALAAASGAGAGETASVAETLGSLAEQAAYNAEVEKTSGEAAKSGYYDQAALYRKKGQSDYKGSLLEGFARGFSGLSKAFG